MKKINLIFLLVLVTTTTGCFHDDDDIAVVVNNPVTPAPEPGTETTDFTTYIKDLLLTTADNTDPVEIESITFSFNEDETAFNDVL